MDRFEVEAVDLGELTHCVVGHDADGVGEGWLCEKIVVTDRETSKQWLFICNKYVLCIATDQSVTDLVKEYMFKLHLKDVIRGNGLLPVLS